jgi:Family of unknown function (DUF5683)
MRIVVILVVMLLTAQVALAQETKADSLRNTQPTDTTFIKSDAQVVPIESYAKKFDPRKAMMYSAVFPGAGQAYNKKYWKMPLVYGGFAVLLSFTSFYNERYQLYREDLFILLNDPTDPSLSPLGYSEETLRNAINSYRRERDFFLILNGFWYILQMVDAHVDAHLKEFDLNPKMQVRLEPMLDNSALTGRNTGVALKIRF